MFKNSDMHIYYILYNIHYIPYYNMDIILRQRIF